MNRTGRAAAELAAAWNLTRPRQWPVLSAQFAVGLALALPPGTAAPLAAAGLSWWPVFGGWLAWVVLLNGGTLAFNSAWDRDTAAVAYLSRPPQPPHWLAAASLAWMATGAVVGTLAVGPGCGALIAGCLLLSVAYSHPRPRLKGRPGLDLLVNMLGYGAGTTAAGLLAGRAALPARAPAAGPAAPLLVAAFGLLFGSFYPLTQLYQRDADLARGDRTLATRLGARNALGLSLALGLGALVVLQAALALAGRGSWRGLPALAAFLWLAHLWWWRQRAERLTASDQERGMYRALGLWALLDAALVAAWLLAPR